MTEHVQTLLRQALKLSRDERADVVLELLASLDELPSEDPEGVQAAWANEIERRAHRVLAGDSAGEAWEDVRDDIARRLTQTQK